MSYIYEVGAEPQHNAILLVGDHDMVLGYAQSIELPPMEKIASGEGFKIEASKIMLDATSLPSDVEDVMPDLASYLFTVVVKFGDRAELRLKNCSLPCPDTYLLHPNSRYIEFAGAKIAVPRRR